ncbi:unnamed protein product [Prorocentrum cordatum]|uniref:Uncharacterized protein n=1 Tax=Prorocentrum cordatum TaxID=2364126 RepID=A0ABN9SBS1_9DINO|nr:unnamed protein product [Polarella glacialis]
MLPGWAQAPPSTRHCPPLLSGSLRVPVRCCPRPGFVLSASRRQAPEYIWHLCRGPYVHPTAVSVREFLLQSEDWMVMAFYDASGTPVPQPPPLLHRLAFESDAFRRRSMFDGVAPSKADWWAFSQRFVDGLASCGVKPRVVGSSCQRQDWACTAGTTPSSRPRTSPAYFKMLEGPGRNGWTDAASRARRG